MSAVPVMLTDEERQEQQDIAAEMEMSIQARMDYAAEVIVARSLVTTVKRRIKRPHYMVARLIERFKSPPRVPGQDDE